jgi:hypothetical protein
MRQSCVRLVSAIAVYCDAGRHDSGSKSPMWLLGLESCLSRILKDSLVSPQHYSQLR